MDISAKGFCYVGTEEGLVPEAYKDSEGIWTWAMGLATTGGYDVLKFKDNPQPLAFCMQESLRMVRAKYLPIVAGAFTGHPLTDNQVAAALSFCWRNGHLHAQWVRDFMAGNMDAAYADWMQWTNHGTQVARAQREHDLFFHAKWPADMRIPVYQVIKPSYHPAHPVMMDLMPLIQSIMGGS